MPNDYTPPELNLSAFHCPHCQAYSSFHWSELHTTLNSFVPFESAICKHCNKHLIWINEEGYGEQRMIYPESTSTPPPNSDLPKECLKDYLEAQSIAGKSPRGAAALLRLCIQKLCVHIGGKGKNINNDIAVLVENGLPQRVQKALDIVRVVGNNAVHPGELIIEDNPKTALALFSLINLIVDSQISQDKQVDDLFDLLPKATKEAVSKRDSKSK